MEMQKTSKEKFSSELQENLNREFFNSTDCWTIQEEYPFASGQYVDVEVRVNKTIETKTGLNRGDDYKTILFKDIDHVTGVGYLYYFDENYWIVINSEKIKSLTASAVVKRCNNTLRWIDTSNGNVNSVPCAIEYLIKQNRDYSTAGSALVTPSGSLEVITQFNTTSNKIKSSQRFLFGNADNWQGFKVQGGGINNFIGLKTGDLMSTGIIILSMYYSQKGDNEVDDLINGIADVGEFNYVLTLNESVSSLENGKSLVLIPTLTLNGKTASGTLVWASNKTSVATVNSSGVVSSVGNGSCIISCSLEGNDSVTFDCVVTVSASVLDTYEVIVNPDTNFVLQGNTQNFLVNLYKNGIIQADTFVFDLDAGNTVPVGKFNLTLVDGNNFTIENLGRYLTSTLKVNCVSGIYSKVVEVTLKGAW
jgi:hypothetical protein